MNTMSIADRGLTRNTRRLLDGLVRRGVSFDRHYDNFYVGRNLGQGMMNKAAGEAAPTWYLMADGLLRHGEVVVSGEVPTAIYEGKSYHGVDSHMPLTWIGSIEPASDEILATGWFR